MDLLISLIIYLSFFCLIAWGAYWIIKKYELPQPFLWGAGVVLLIVLLIFAARISQGGFPLLKLT